MKLPLQNKPNLAKCAPNIEKVDNSIYNLKGKLANFISHKQQMKINQKMNYHIISKITKEANLFVDKDM